MSDYTICSAASDVMISIILTDDIKVWFELLQNYEFDTCQVHDNPLTLCAGVQFHAIMKLWYLAHGSLLRQKGGKPIA